MTETKWRVWNSAPKDGRLLLAWFGDDCAETVRRNPDGSWYFALDGDTTENTDGSGRKPTHWTAITPPVR